MGVTVLIWLVKIKDSSYTFCINLKHKMAYLKLIMMSCLLIGLFETSLGECIHQCSSSDTCTTEATWRDGRTSRFAQGSCFSPRLEGAALASLNHVNLVDRLVEITMDDILHLSFLVLVGRLSHHQHADMLKMEMENMTNYVKQYAEISLFY